MIGPGETLDQLCGHFRVFQLADGHRYSTDDVLTAWYGVACAPSPSRVLDLGSGIGSVGMLAAWRLPGSRFVTIEAQTESARLARKSARLNGLESRYDIREFDFRSPEALRPDEKFDLVLGSPPYFPLGTGVPSPHPQKLACRFEVRGSIHDYCATAARALAPGGLFACVFPIQPEHQEERVFEACIATGLRMVRRKNVVLKEGEPPLLGLFAFNRREDLPADLPGEPLWHEPDLVIRNVQGKATAEYLAVKLSMGLPPTN